MNKLLLAVLGFTLIASIFVKMQIPMQEKYTIFLREKVGRKMQFAPY